jgi:hypothetical protein
MRKFGIISLTIFISCIIAGIYGIVHDQITYSISEEYFTKFKFIQFGFHQIEYLSNREIVTIIGFFATWWMGLIIGTILGLTGLIFSDHKQMRKMIVKAITITIAVSIISGFAGYLIGKFYLSETGVSWWMPDNLEHKRDFITVGSIHNFSYLGGVLGLLTGISYMIIQKSKLNRSVVDNEDAN